MARVQYSGVPDTVPTQNAGDDYQHIVATPAQFGSLIAEGIHEAGSGLTDLAKFHDEVSGDDANNTFTDGAAQLRAKLRSLSGRDALNYFPQAKDDLKDLYENTRESLHTPQAQLYFDQISRRYRALVEGDMADYAAQAQREYGLQTNADTINVNKNLAAVAQQHNDAAGLQQAQENLRWAYGKSADIRGLTDPDSKTAATLDADREFTVARIDGALAHGDAGGAWKVLQDNNSTLAGMSGYDQLVDSVKHRVQDLQLDQFSNTARGPAPTAAATSLPTEQQAAAFVQRAFPGSQITSEQRTPQHNAAVGGVPDSMHITGNAIDFVAPKGTTLQQVQDAITKSGFPATEVLNEGDHFHVGWRPKGGDAAGAQTGAQDPRAWAESQWPGDAEFADRAAAAAERAAVWKRAGISDSFDNVEAMVSDGKLPATWPSAQQIADAYPNDPERVRTLTERLDELHTIAPKIAQLPSMTPAQIEQTSASLTPDAADQETYGQRSRMLSIWQSAVAGYEKSLASDPAGTILQNHPSIASEWNASLKDPARLAPYIRDTLAAQATAGVPPEMQRVLPSSVARNMVSTLVTAQPADAVKRMNALEAEGGTSWPRVYADLARAGLPPSFQALAVANTSNRLVIAQAITKDAESGKHTFEDSLVGLRAMASDGQLHTYPEVIDQTIASDQGLANLRTSLGVAGRAGIDLYAGLSSAVRTTALYLSATTGMDPQASAQRAAAMITSAFNFVPQPGRPPVRLPTSVSTTDFQTATQSVLTNLSVKDIQPYRIEGDFDHQPISATREQLATSAVQGAKLAYWVTVPGTDGNGAVRAIDPQSGRPVVMSDGKPLEISFAKLPGVAARARMSVQQAQQRDERIMQQEMQEK